MEFEPEFIEVVAPGGRPRATAMLVHGILGSGANWRSFARKLVTAHPEWRVVLPDLRNHGRSRGALPPHTVAACAADLARLGRRFDVAPSVCIGHSYGGKVALAWARDHGGDHAREVWALDSPPGTGRGADESSADGVGRVLEALRRVRMPVARREDLVAALDELGLSAAVAQWMTTNLEAAPGGYRWRFDMDAIEAMVDEYLRANLWPVVEAPPVGLRVGLVIAGRGGRYDRAERLRAERARGPRVEVHELPGSGHWVHVDAPGPLAALLGDVLARSLPAD